jgi:hypothetical protein
MDVFIYVHLINDNMWIWFTSFSYYYFHNCNDSKSQLQTMIHLSIVSYITQFIFANIDQYCSLDLPSPLSTITFSLIPRLLYFKTFPTT